MWIDKKSIKKIIMRKAFICLLAAFCAFASLSSVYAMGATADPVVRMLNLTRNLPPEIVQSPKFTNQAFKNFSHVDYFNYYEALKDIKRVVSVFANSIEGLNNIRYESIKAFI